MFGSILDDAFDRALASYYLTPYSAQLGSKMGTLVHGHNPTTEGKKKGSLGEFLRGLWGILVTNK